MNQPVPLNLYAAHGLLEDDVVARTTIGGRNLDPMVESVVGLPRFIYRLVSWGEIKGDSDLTIPDDSRFLGLVYTGDFKDVVPVLAIQATRNERRALREYNFRNQPFKEITAFAKREGKEYVNITVPVLKDPEVGVPVLDSFADPFLTVGISRDEAIAIAKAVRRDLGFPELTIEGKRALASEAALPVRTRR